ncbi:MAG: winged helix-turn-helix transcriptional regulator [Nitrospirae bacterium]|nr:winged helix-turn-helix transcriptional regulator [Nitrospirota bacterium]
MAWITPSKIRLNMHYIFFLTIYANIIIFEYMDIGNRKEILRFHAEFCKTFSNPIRLEILDILKNEEETVTEIAKKLGIPKTNASQHLSVMRTMWILKTRKDGAKIYYSIADKKLIQACDLMRGALAQLMRSIAAAQNKKLSLLIEKGGKYNVKDH